MNGLPKVRFGVVVLAAWWALSSGASAGFPETTLDPAAGRSGDFPVEPAATTDPRDVSILDDVRVGHWVEVRGRLEPDGSFEAERIEVMEPRSRGQVWGVAEADPTGGESSTAATRPRRRALRVLGHQIELDSDTSWRGGSYQDALGQRVRVDGVLGTSGRILARRIEIKDAGTERILGRVDARRTTAEGALVLEVMGHRVHLDPSIKQRARGPIAALERTAPRPMRSPFSSVEDDDDLFGEGFSPHRDVNIRVQQDLAFSSRHNFEIDDRNDTDVDERDDRDDAGHNLRAQLTWTPDPRWMVLLDARARNRRRQLDRGVSETRNEAEIGEAWLLVRDIGFGVDVQVGRQDYDDPREWLYDQNLDGVRLFKETERLHLQLGVSTTLSDGSTRDHDATNTILYVSNREGRGHFAGYMINRDFSGSSPETRTHYGLRAFGPWTPRLTAWGELSGLNGERSGTRVSGWAGDVGVTLRARPAGRTALTLGLAQASGDRPGGRNTEFRQTGLQDNDARLGGVSAVRYYGELLDPELSNLQVTTVGLAVRVMKRSSIEIIGHSYRQVVASTSLRNTNIDQRPLGLSRDLGWEVDLVLGVRRFANWDFEVVTARFRPGEAFSVRSGASGTSSIPTRDDATIMRFQIRYRY